MATDIPEYSISIPAGWSLLPGKAHAEQIDTIVAGFEVAAETAERLRFALGNVNDIALHAPGRVNWALVSDPASGRVDAMMSLSFPKQDQDSYAAYRTAVDAVKSTEEFEQVERTVIEKPLPAGPAIVVHEFVLPRTEGGVPDPAVERAIVAMFPAGFESFFEFALMTQDLAVFEDAAEYLVDIAAQVHLQSQDVVA
ncbi:MAG: hypothetical protein ABI632_00165 [Pseudolysinimonas sp.]